MSFDVNVYKTMFNHDIWNMQERLKEEIALKLRKISKFNLKENWTS